MYPVLFEIFGLPVRAYGVFIAIGFLAGMWLAQRVARRYRPEFTDRIEEFGIYALVGAIVGARIWEVTFTWDYYRENLLEVFAIWHGGISIQGAIAGGAVVAAWYCRSRKLSFWSFADVLTPGVVLGQAIGRLGACLLNGDAYGKPTGSSFGLVYAPGTPAYEAFGAVPLWPAEVFEGVWDLGIMVFALWLLRRKRFDGQVFLWYVVIYSVGRFSLEFLRADSLGFLGLKAAQVTSVVLALGALAALLLRNARQNRQQQT